MFVNYLGNMSVGPFVCLPACLAACLFACVLVGLFACLPLLSGLPLPPATAWLAAWLPNWLYVVASFPALKFARMFIGLFGHPPPPGSILKGLVLYLVNIS